MCASREYEKKGMQAKNQMGSYMWNVDGHQKVYIRMLHVYIRMLYVYIRVQKIRWARTCGMLMDTKRYIYMYVCIYIHIYIYIYTYMHIYIYFFLYIYIYIFIHTHIYIYREREMIY